MTIRYTPAARDDLRAVKAWIIGEFGDAAVADKAVVDIIKGIAVLKRNPQLARPLQDKVHRKTDYKVGRGLSPLSRAGPVPVEVRIFHNTLKRSDRR